MKKAEFIKSSTSLEQCPKSRLPEFALIGRSNVGKSSLINMLTGQASLAKVSKTPGEPLTASAQPGPAHTRDEIWRRSHRDLSAEKCVLLSAKGRRFTSITSS